MFFSVIIVVILFYTVLYGNVCMGDLRWRMAGGGSSDGEQSSHTSVLVFKDMRSAAFNF